MDMFAIGEKVGVLSRRMTDQERRQDRTEKRLDLWSRNLRRLTLVFILWSVALMGLTSIDDAAKFAVAVYHKI